MQQAWSRTGYAGRRPPDSDAYLIPMVIDTALPSLAGGTVLTLPLGNGLVIDHLVTPLLTLGHAKVLVVSPDASDRPYADRVDPDVRARLQVVARRDLTGVLARQEASDYLLLVDPRRWPAAGYDFAFVAARARAYQGATHALAVGAGAGATQERIEYDPQGRIRRVQRLYSPMSWPATAAATVFCSVAPARALCDLAFESLDELRHRLVDRGVLGQDLPVLTDIDDLTGEAGVLGWSQRLLEQMIADPPADLPARQPGVLVGEGCRIDASARLVPPVLIQDYTTIGPGAMLVGPVVVGASSRIGARALVAQSLLQVSAEVADDAVISNTLSSGAAASVPPQAPADAPVEEDLALPCQWRPANLALQDLPHRGRLQAVVKRLADITLSTLGLLALSPLLIIVAILIKVFTPGPVFFVHRREGKGGRKFGCLKFRTMVTDAHARQRELYQQNQVDGPQFKMDNDPRVTWLGRWLRATNVDELPQLFNVLAGQMSLVGPRPSPFRENQICVAWRRARLSVRPGITGLWQICRDRCCDGDFHQWIFYDITYVKHYSLWLDVRILLQTILSRGGRRRVLLARLIDTHDPDLSALATEPAALHAEQGAHA